MFVFVTFPPSSSSPCNAILQEGDHPGLGHGSTGPPLTDNWRNTPSEININ